MRVRVLVSMSGPGGSWRSGDPYDCSEAEAGRLIAAGTAEPWGGEIEAAAVEPPERAVSRKKVTKRKAKKRSSKK
jgi:hypothetical protein